MTDADDSVVACTDVVERQILCGVTKGRGRLRYDIDSVARFDLNCPIRSVICASIKESAADSLLCTSQPRLL